MSDIDLAVVEDRKVILPDSIADFIELAEILQARQSIVKSDFSQREYTLSEIYAVADEKGVDRVFVDLALERCCVSPELVLAKFGDLDVVHSPNSIVRCYRESVLAALAKSLPHNVYSPSGTRDERFRVHLCDFFPGKTTGIGPFKHVEKSGYKLGKEVADFEFAANGFTVYRGMVPCNYHMAPGVFRLDITIKDPSFLEACGDVLIELKERFADQCKSYSVQHDW